VARRKACGSLQLFCRYRSKYHSLASNLTTANQKHSNPPVVAVSRISTVSLKPLHHLSKKLKAYPIVSRRNDILSLHPRLQYAAFLCRQLAVSQPHSLGQKMPLGGLLLSRRPWPAWLRGRRGLAVAAWLKLPLWPVNSLAKNVGPHSPSRLAEVAVACS